MTTRRLVIASAFLACAALPAFADERVYDLPAFDRIDVSAGIKVIASVGEPQAVSVRTVHGDFSDLEIGVRDGELSISREWNRLRWHSKRVEYKVSVSTPDLIGIAGSSGSHAEITNVDSPTFEIDLSSGAHAEIKGVCGDCAVDLSSGANLDAQTLLCERADIDVSSGGHGTLSVIEAVNGDASSGGHVSVYGNPKIVNVDRSSGGRIKIKSDDNHVSRN